MLNERRERFPVLPCHVRPQERTFACLPLPWVSLIALVALMHGSISMSLWSEV